MANALPAPTPAPKIGWDGQSPLVVPKAGLFLTPGVGLVGRTANGKLLLDAASYAATESYTAFAPGAVTARTFGRWRNRRANQNGTLAVMEAFLATAPTAGDASNFWRLVATDALGSSVVLPISAAGQNFYDLDRGAGVDLIAPWTYDPTNAVSWGQTDANCAAYVNRITPTQSMTLAGASFRGHTTSPGAGAQVRGSLVSFDGTTVLGSGSCYSTGVFDVSGNETFHVVFDQSVAVTAGTDYWMVWDVGVSAGTLNTFTTLAGAGVVSNTILAGTPSKINGVSAGSGVAGSASNSFKLNYSGGGVAGNQLNITPANIIAQFLAHGRAAFSPWDNVNSGLSVANALTCTGCWSIAGTVSGIAPIQGDVTLKLQAVGAPAAGAAGADLNARILILP